MEVDEFHLVDVIKQDNSIEIYCFFYLRIISGPGGGGVGGCKYRTDTFCS